MSDKGKSAAIEILRKEVGFGCPVCRSPFLTWHHFDPPEHVEKHWRPEGMIALCLVHHPNADGEGYGGNAYSPDELRAMKRITYSQEDVKANFPSWQKKNILVRLGGCYTSPSNSVLSVSGVPQIALRRNQNGLLSLSFELRDSSDAVIVKMEDNWFVVTPKNVHDMIVTPKTHEIKVWHKEEDVGLELSFRRISLDDLKNTMDQDFKLANKKFLEVMDQQWASMPPEVREYMKASTSQDQNNRLFDHTVRWVTENCQMDDGLIPFLNFEQMAIYSHGSRIKVKDGVTDAFNYCGSFGNGGGFNLACPCRKCSNQV